MNKTLHALMTKLQWQLAKIDEQLQTLEQQLNTIELQCQENQQKMTNACAIPAFILPEREIARLNFMICQSQHHDELTTQKRELLSQQSTLTTKKIRVNMELKMLEKYQEKKLKDAQQQTTLAEQNEADEWVLQQREQA